MTRLPLLLLPCLLYAAPLSALEFEPGKWKVTMVSSSPFGGERKQTKFECVKDRNFDPTGDLAGEGDCRITDRKETASELKWTMECAMDGAGKMIGTGHFSSRGGKASGEMVMKMNFGGQTMTMSNVWDGQRVGACD